MKICSICNQTYADDNLNYCLNDGGILTKWNDDAAPTVMLNQPRITQQNWGNYSTRSSWESQPLQTNQPFQPLQQNQPFYPAQMQEQNQTLPVVALVLGICSLLFMCCYGGIPFGGAALVLGFLGIKNANENPMQYGGRGLAIGGIVTGVIGLLISFIILLMVAAG
jgi:hypothetical protein